MEVPDGDGSPNSGPVGDSSGQAGTSDLGREGEDGRNETGPGPSATHQRDGVHVESHPYLNGALLIPW